MREKAGRRADCPLGPAAQVEKCRDLDTYGLFGLGVVDTYGLFNNSTSIVHSGMVRWTNSSYLSPLIHTAYLDLELTNRRTRPPTPTMLVLLLNVQIILS
jgi:hypothetical protein